MRRLAVVAHYDVRGQVAGHALRNIEALARTAQRCVVVSTADLDGAAQALVRARAELLMRPNEGYDFFSYKVGLDAVGDRESYDEVVLSNDSFVGPLVPYPEIFAAMDRKPVDYWGFTVSRRRFPHVQSFFVAFRPWVVRSEAFRSFWDNMRPVSARSQVISAYELGLSRTLTGGRIPVRRLLLETESDRRTARRRHLWWAFLAARMRPSGLRWEAFQTLREEPWNPVSALADRALDEGRLPFVKIDTLRYDPYGLGSSRFLRPASAAIPKSSPGSASSSPRPQPDPRRAMEAGGQPPPLPLRPVIGYAR